MTRWLPVVVRARRPFGLDPVRRPDPARLEAAVLATLEEGAPAVMPLPVRAAEGPAIVLLQPGGGAAVLRIEPAPSPRGRPPTALEAACRRSRVPVGTLRRVQDIRAAMRRFGIELDTPGKEA